MDIDKEGENDDGKFTEQEEYRVAAEEAERGKRYEEALKNRQGQLRAMQERLGINAWEVLQLKQGMAELLSRQTRKNKAEILYREILDSTFVVLVKSDLKTTEEEYTLLAEVSVTWLKERAVYYHNQKRYVKADELLTIVFGMARQIRGDVDPLSQSLQEQLRINCLSLLSQRSNDQTLAEDVSELQVSAELPSRKRQRSDSGGTSTFSAAPLGWGPPASLQTIPAEATVDICPENDGKLWFDDCELFEKANDPYTGTDSDKWFSKKLDLYTQPLLEPYRSSTSRHTDKRHRRVRVAIIDTGIDMSHSDVQKFKERIRDFKSWIPGEPDADDDSGHGTHLTMSLLRVAPETDVYVARVFSRTQQEVSSNLGPAVRHAVNEWEVDIISMSFGSPLINQDLQDAIGFAAYKNVLMFAAAANHGKLERIPRAYPARDYRVFCISSTDGNGNPSRFNPEAQEGDLNFCVLGEAVLSATINGKRVRKSGTSVATIIATGIAALIIEFCRQTRVDGEREVDDPDSLTTYQGMRQVLKTMSKKEGKFHPLSPWMVITMQQDLSSTKKARDEIASEISNSLKLR